MNACTAIRAQAERNMWSKAPDLSTHSACQLRMSFPFAYKDAVYVDDETGAVAEH
mgnify:CR=1 FL=1